MLMKELVELAQNCNTVYISGHVHPDGDCIGACLALTQLLKKFQIKAKPLLKDVADTYHYLSGINEIGTNANEEAVDLFIALDCGDKGRLGEFAQLFDNAETTVNIDHHISNTQYGDINHVVSHASSTCEIIFSMLTDKSVVDKHIAEALYTGIVYDTGIFKHDNTSETTHKIAGELTTFGINTSEIINRLFFYKSFTAFKLLGIASKESYLALDNKLIISAITLEHMRSIHASKSDTDGIIGMMNEVIGPECAILIYQVDTKEFKVSFRSRGKVDVCLIARKFDGGGHTKAAGCTMFGNLDSIKQQLIDEVAKQLSLI